MKDYNDYLIISPSKMEEVAKKYFQELKSAKDKNEYYDTNLYNMKENKNYIDIVNNLQTALCEINNLNNLCTKNFYASKCGQVRQIVEKLSIVVRYKKVYNYLLLLYIIVEIF